MNKIYIIGNGFDLHHKLLSRYSHFYDYLKNDRNSIEIIRTFDCFINLSNDKWSNFEEDIALLNEKSFIDYYKDELLIDINSEKMDFFLTEISTDINNILLRLPYKMTEWILSLDINSVEKIHSIQRLFDSDDYHVITFNYTKVLEKIYEIDKSKVTHIHGIADDKNSKIILGHSQVNKKSSVSSNGDYRIDEAIQLFNMYYKKTRKPTEEVIQDNIELFYKLNKLKEVIIIGHSMSDVDIPYYKKMIENIDINEVKWKVYHHHTQSSHFFIETLSKLGVNEENIKTVNINVLRNIPSSKHDG